MNTISLVQTEIIGLQYITDFISKKEEQYFIQKIDSSAWQSVLTRHVQQYGYSYDYKTRDIESLKKYIEFPDWIKKLAQSIYTDGLISTFPDQLIINDYPIGNGIASHIDSERCFGDTIIILSLGSGCNMDFVKATDESNLCSFYLHPRSLLVLKDEARYKWLHGIKGASIDNFNNKQIPRDRRLSMSFRNIIKNSLIG